MVLGIEFSTYHVYHPTMVWRAGPTKGIGMDPLKLPSHGRRYSTFTMCAVDTPTAHRPTTQDGAVLPTCSGGGRGDTESITCYPCSNQFKTCWCNGSTTVY